MSHNVTSQAWLSVANDHRQFFNDILATVDISRACYFHQKCQKKKFETFLFSLNWPLSRGLTLTLILSEGRLEVAVA